MTETLHTREGKRVPDVAFRIRRDGDWATFLTTLRSALPPFLANFERLREIGVPDDPVLEDLVAHERAIDRFADLELQGRHVDALAALDAHLANA